jgi:S1-C subfamily serine protease
MQTAGDVALPMASRRPVEFLRPGNWILVLWRRETQEHAFAPANYLGTQEIRCWDSSFQEVVTTLALSDLMSGGGLFDLDGNLLGLVVSCNGRPTVLSNASVQAALDYGASFDGRMSTRYGMRIENLGEAEQAYHKRKNGVIIMETWRGYGADRAGLLPGDLIVSLEEKPLRSVDDLELMVLPVAQEIFELRVLRGGRPLALRLRARPPSTHDDEDLHAGLKLSTPAQGYPIDFVLAGSPAAIAGIQPGDRLLKIDYEDPANANAVRQAFAKSRTGPLHLVLERGDRRWAVLLE